MSSVTPIGLILLFLLHVVSLSHLCSSRYSAKKTIAVWSVLILISAGIVVLLIYFFL